MGVRSQPQAVQALAARQPLSPVPSAAALQQVFMDDSGNRAASALTSKPALPSGAYFKSPLKMMTPNSPRLSDLENTTPRMQLEFSFEERRASIAHGDLHSGFWMGGNP